MIKYLILFSVLITAATASFADTVILKNGQRIQGKIFEETRYSVKMTVNGLPKVFYSDQIEKVERGQDESPKVSSDVVQPLTFDEVPESKRKLILRLMDANGAREGIQQTLRGLVGQLTAEQRLEFEKLVQSEDLVLKFVPIYATYYSEEEIRDLIKFYSSPSGKRVLEVTPKIMEESMKAAIEYFKTAIK